MFVLGLAVGLVPLLRSDRVARFWALGMMLSILPICATFASDRLLPFVGIGAMGLLAQWVHFVFGRTPSLRPPTLRGRIPVMCLVAFLLLDHLVIAPVTLPLRARYTLAPKQLMDMVNIQEPFDSSIKNQDLIVVNPPVAFLLMGSFLEKEAKQQPLPRRTRVLTSSLFRPVHIHRPDANTLVVRPHYGYYVWVLDRLFRCKERPLSQGDRIVLTGMTAEILEVGSNNIVTNVAFRFDKSLEDPSHHWLQWQDGHFMPFTPPQIGESKTLKPFSQATHWREWL